MRSAFILGGTGLIGRAVEHRLLIEGFEVVIASRKGGDDQDGVRHVSMNRNVDEEFQAATKGDHDLFVDIVAYGRRHAEQLRSLDGRVGTMVVVSSAAVYADRDGHTLLGSAAADGSPIVETDPVVAPVDEGRDYAGGKVAMERSLLDSDLPVTILRPGAIFGPGDRASREWHFVKRVIDERPTVLLSYEGRSVFHHVSSTNVAEMVILAADRPGKRLLNCGDTHVMTVHEIADEVAVHLDHEWTIVPFAGPPHGTVGDTPWTTPSPFLLDLSAARRDLGFTGARDHRAALGSTIEWLVTETEDRAWDTVLPGAAKHYGDKFDYDAEDRFLAQGPSQ